MKENRYPLFQKRYNDFITFQFLLFHEYFISVIFTIEQRNYDLNGPLKKVRNQVCGYTCQ